MEKIIALIKKNKETLLYLIVGGLTTLVDFITYLIFTRIFDLAETPSTAVAWAVSVLFAFVANKIFVFESKGKKIFGIFIEITLFFLARVATGALNVLFVFVFVDKLDINDILIKMINYALNIILNYLASKFIIFRKGKKEVDNLQDEREEKQ